jgi:hypothetical protein
MRLCILDANGVCVNAIEADQPDERLLPEGHTFASDHSGNIGWHFVNGAWVEPTPPAPTADEVRDQRNRLLTAADWTQVADAPVDQAAWATYRQALRDIPQQAGFPHDVIWPQKPER